jgi:hypothetical protein
MRHLLKHALHLNLHANRERENEFPTIGRIRGRIGIDGTALLDSNAARRHFGLPDHANLQLLNSELD